MLVEGSWASLNELLLLLVGAISGGVHAPGVTYVTGWMSLRPVGVWFYVGE